MKMFVTKIFFWEEILGAKQLKSNRSTKTWWKNKKVFVTKIFFFQKKILGAKQVAERKGDEYGQ